MNKMIRKGYGRILVADKSKVEEVIAIIKEVDEFEFDYMPKDFVTAFIGTPELKYTHKFEIDTDKLILACWNKGIYIWCISQNDQIFDHLM